MTGTVKLDAAEFNRNMEIVEGALTRLRDNVDLIFQQAKNQSADWIGDAKECWIDTLMCILEEIEEKTNALATLGAQADRLRTILEKTHRKVSEAVEGVGKFE